MHIALLSQRPIAWRGAANGVKLVCDGNSITAGGQDGAQSVGGVCGWLKRNQEPFSAQAYANVAIGGQDTDAMISSATDVDGAFDAAKTCVLFAQELTNQIGIGAHTATNAVQRLIDFLAARRAAHPWAAIVVATAPPVWLGDQYTQGQTDAFNATCDEANALLRSRYREAADALIETRAPGGPFDPAAWPNYLRATFFETTVRTDAFGNAYSNNQLFTNETANQIRIHYSVTGIVALAPIFAATLLRLRAR